MQQQQQQSVFPFMNLPKEIQRRLVLPFLGPRDALNLSQTCKALHTNAAVSILRPPMNIFDQLRWSGSRDQGDTIYRAFRLPIYNSHVRAHTVRLDCTWRDQGWGNCKGEAWIVAIASQSSVPNEGSFGEGQVVVHSRLDSHEPERLQMEFSPKEGMTYHCYYKVGGGGGHELFFSNGRLHALMYDDTFHSLSKNYKALLDNGALTTVKFPAFLPHASHQAIPRVSAAGANAASAFIPRILLAACQLLRRQQSEAEKGGEVAAAVSCPRQLQHIASPEITAVLQEFNIPHHASSLLAMGSWLEEEIVLRTLVEQERAQAKSSNRVD